ncbi:hypothetical protein JOD54_002805 [Actinokineospora baliensis]|uniref:hypothetical protein n=1 Tax=Actinokineospora baliensis TaxID=547056 RepID=UPI00195E6165|nr:hypothetical protein [Actinokineospora baliensis]MBM7772601.1 hypothetical protein [Actinokineospora baliensis]
MRTTVLRLGAALGFVAFSLGLATATATSAAAETTDDRTPAESIVPDLTINVINADSVNVASPLIDLTGTNP